MRRALVARDYVCVCGGVFFRNDFDCGEVFSEAGTRELVCLLSLAAFGHQDQPVPGGELRQKLADAWKQLYLVVGDALGEAANLLMLMLADGAFGKAFKAGDERTREAD